MANAAAASGRATDDVLLVAITKFVGVAEIEVLYNLGIRHFGENRIDAAAHKLEHFAGSDITWHMIGNIQRRKVAKIVGAYQRVDAIDRIALAEEFEKRADSAATHVPILLEVNVSGEESKHGFSPDELVSTVERVGEMPHLDLKGLMTMAPRVDDPETTRPFFRKLKNLVEEFRFPVCSMGMTNDFEQAIQEGATEVRIGSALFEGLTPESS